MKGLLIKDFKLLKNQKGFMLVMILICISLLVKGNDPTYVFSYLAAMISVLGIGTIGYDEENNGMGFLFTFPVSRSKYVLEKYVFGMLVLAVVLAAGAAVTVIASAVKAPEYEPVDWLVVLMGVLVTFALIQSVTIPLQLKFGSARSRAALLLVIVCVGIAAYGAKQIAEMAHMDLSEIAAVVMNASTEAVVAGIVILSLGMMGISYAVSVAVMKRKQF